MPPPYLQVLPVSKMTIEITRKAMAPIATIIALLYLPFHTFMAIMFATMTDSEGLLPDYLQVVIQLGGIVLMLLTTGIVGAIVNRLRSKETVDLVSILRRAGSLIGFLVVPGFLPIVISLLVVFLNQQPMVLDQIFRVLNSFGLIWIFLLMWYVAFSGFYVFSVMNEDAKPLSAFTTAWKVFIARFFYMTMYLIVIFFVYGLVLLLLMALVGSMTSSLWLQIPLQTGVKFVETFFMIALAVLYYRIGAEESILPSKTRRRDRSSK